MSKQECALCLIPSLKSIRRSLTAAETAFWACHVLCLGIQTTLIYHWYYYSFAISIQTCFYASSLRPSDLFSLSTARIIVLKCKTDAITPQFKPLKNPQILPEKSSSLFSLSLMPWRFGWVYPVVLIYTFATSSFELSELYWTIGISKIYNTVLIFVQACSLPRFVTLYYSFPKSQLSLRSPPWWVTFLCSQSPLCFFWS